MVDKVGDRLELGLADIARLAGVGAAAVSNWRRRHDTFPLPVGGTDRSPRFALADVEAWLATQGRSLEITPQERAWRALDAARAGADPLDLLVGVGLMLLREQGSASDPSAHRGRGSPFEGWSEPPPAVVRRIAAGLDGDVGPEVFDALVNRFLDSGGRAGAVATSTELAQVLVKFGGSGRGAVLDPACGVGTVLSMAAATGFTPAMGQEVDPSLARLAAVRLALRGVEAAIVAGDALAQPAPLPVSPTLVVCDPPFGERSWGQESLVGDDRFAYGHPPKGEPELAWAQVAVSNLMPGGRAVVVMPQAAASRPAGRRIRRALVTSGALLAVVALPPGLATHYTLSLQIWVLTDPVSASGADGVLMVDAGNAGNAGDDWVSVRTVAEQMAAILEGHGHPPNGGEAVGGAQLIRRVSALEILDQDAELAPRRYLASPAHRELSVKDVNERIDTLGEKWGALAESLTEIRGTVERSTRDPSTSGSPDRPELTIDELVKLGSLVMRRRAGRDRAESKTISAAILTGADLALRRPPSEKDDVDADTLRNPPIRIGDVLVPTVATRLRARVAGEAEAGCYPGSGVIVLRPDPAVVDPWYLAGMLSSAQMNRQADRVGSSMGGALKVDVRRLRLPVPSLEEQQRWGAAFRMVETTAQLLHEAVAEADGLLQEVGDAFATWATSATPPKTTLNE